ncbi:tRNA (adenosine(37)-N6)-threonylcarbamoyltransferase complex ATPase subunit type 1 TsaE [Sphingomonas sp. 8AM]|uniref:tRNA (adenosine(37)-N6)-threonylcarbamoyltransferase complex ATPase subunit type 1 TsaE n=1 Tax=Sphingomonas sp. 8AM TaxID=2653170 RepID=UPI0012F16311|nr:tRNA (adenosine(37)-N6)-threonylcarbamoyltransferase complex ATPase subunit type 1 TsaE [Sphingomonas sp. 8AM]VXC56493.1 tRNA threonylcarbamoyladenosine biosynthesis protein TsaE [Sphingomonas sp. 8AM]
MKRGAEWLADVTATAAAGARLAEVLRAGDVVTLTGGLGAGKTSLARGVLAALGLAEEAPSPTFAIVQPYEPPNVRLPVLHVDLYRLEDPAEVDELGLEEARLDAALLVEWPERAGAARWPDALALDIAWAPDGARRLTWTAPAAWDGRWPR